MVCKDAQRRKRNLNMAWIDVAKAYGSVDHGWLSEMFTLHRFPIWFAKVMEKLTKSWNTRIAAQTTQGKEISPKIRFKKGLPQGDALCPMLFILCLNPIAWKVAVADGKEVEAKKVKQAIYKARQQETQSTVSEERWQGKLIKNRWDDEKVKLEECFAWLSSWKNAPTHTIAGVQELYQQLLPTKVYYNRKTKSQVTDEKCRLCGDSLENVQHILSG